MGPWLHTLGVTTDINSTYPPLFSFLTLSHSTPFTTSLAPAPTPARRPAGRLPQRPPTGVQSNAIPDEPITSAPSQPQVLTTDTGQLGDTPRSLTSATNS